MKVGFLITARLKSSRLPQKLLLDLNGKTVVERVIERCKKVFNIDEIVLCTSLNNQDRPLAEIALKNNIYYFLGDEEDVLKRLLDASIFFKYDYIINITGENPLFSIYHAQLTMNEILKGKYDFVYTSCLPIGCVVYGINVKALKVVCKIKNVVDTEIWGPLINRPEIFNVKEIVVDGQYSRPNLRLTTDYMEDYRLISKIYSQFESDEIPNYFDVIDILDENPDILNINKDRTQASLPIEVVTKINEYFTANKEEIKEELRKTKLNEF